jgi:hypothetical protein
MVVLNNVRLAFPDLFKVGNVIQGSDNEPKFGASFIMEPGSEAFEMAQAAFIHVGAVKFGKNSAAIIAELSKDKKCLRRGDSNLDKEGNVRNGFAGNFYVVARNVLRPAVVGRAKEALQESDGIVYGGCYVNAAVEIYAHESQKLGKRIDAKLLAVQFVGDGDGFNGTKPTADMFGALPDVGGAAPVATSGADLF